MSAEDDRRRLGLQHGLYGHFRHLRDIPVSLPEPCQKGDDPGEVLAADAPLLINVLFMDPAICYLLIIHSADAKISSLLAWRYGRSRCARGLFSSGALS